MIDLHARAAQTERAADHPIHPLFLARWSPRAFSGAPMTREELFTLLEAARWAASSYNLQPWRFIYALRSRSDWSRFLDLLAPTNRVWAEAASALVFFVSKTTWLPRGQDREASAPTHVFDTGAAAASFSLQAVLTGWHVHGMVGFDHERAPAELGLPPTFQANAVFAVGRPGRPANLPQALQDREFPSGRLPLQDLAFEGRMRP